MPRLKQVKRYCDQRGITLASPEVEVEVLSVSNDLIINLLLKDITSDYAYHKSLIRFYNWQQSGI